jgi:magnesium-transporting ATPase (P-type)
MSCGFDGETESISCPQCRRRLRTTTETRISGLLQTFAGILLIGLMGFIGQWFYGVVREGQQTGHSRFTGTDQQMIVIAAIIAFVMLFGIISFIAGFWQLVTGKRNKLLIWLVAGIGILLALGALYIIYYF